MIQVDPEAKISPLADIEDSVRGSLIEIGAHSFIDSFVKIKPAGGVGNLIIGKHVVINSGTVIYTGNGVVIGNNVAVAANCTFAPVDHEYRERGKLIRAQGFRPGRGGIVVEDDVWIGANCVLLDGAILRQGCVVGAGSIIRSEVQSYSINVGQPSKIIGWRK